MVINNWQTRIFSWLNGTLIGVDVYGNRYYQAKFRSPHSHKLKKRWVLYAHSVEPSRIPAAWRGWLHYSYEAPLHQHSHYPWAQRHQENTTGTSQAYYPPGYLQHQHLVKNSLKHYEPWQPPTE